MKAPILRKETLAPGISRMVLSAPEVAAHAAAGQFIILRPTENSERIPLTISDFDPKAGTVTIGGVDVSRISDQERRTCIGCVEQHFSRVPGSVLDQITLGDPQITAAMAKNAAQLAGIDAAVQALPKGYDTVCMEGMFSQGEWQLLSIARAAAADPAVLLLDEITANLDAETEARVLEALRRASAGRTVLSVSHRIYENLGGRTIEVRAQA